MKKKTAYVIIGSLHSGKSTITRGLTGSVKKRDGRIIVIRDKNNIDLTLFYRGTTLQEEKFNNQSPTKFISMLKKHEIHGCLIALRIFGKYKAEDYINLFLENKWNLKIVFLGDMDDKTKCYNKFTSEQLFHLTVPNTPPNNTPPANVITNRVREFFNWY